MTADAARAAAAAVAADVLAGTIDLLEGSRKLSRLLRMAELPDDDPDLLLFVAIDSETDDLPIGPERVLWNAEALNRKDPEIQDAAALYRAAIEDACSRLIRRFAVDPRSVS